jgi:hypothetical protein
MMVAQQHQAAQRRAGHQRLPPVARSPALVTLNPSTSFSGAIRATVRRHPGDPAGELAQDAVHRRIGIQPVDQREQIGLGRIGRQLVLEGRHADLDRLLVLVRDIDLAGRVLAHQHDRKARHDPVLVLQRATCSATRPRHSPQRPFRR